MTIKRRYSLPNCTLTLEGMSSEETTHFTQEQRPLLSILLNAECHFVESQQLISGGIEFFESLSQAISAYTQEFLSGIRHPDAHHHQSGLVRVERIVEKDLHRITCHSSDSTGDVNRPIQVSLTTVELFDLVEAMDQCLADNRTLPGLAVNLQPVSRRYRKADQSKRERIIPPALGFGTLLAAGLALFLMPVPEVMPPEPVQRESTSESINDDHGGGSTSENGLEGTTTPPEEGETPSSLNSDGDTSSEEGETTSPTTSDSDLPATEEAIALSPEEIEQVLASAAEINNPNELYYIQKHLRSKMYSTWDTRGGFGGKLHYQVSAARDGSVLAYEPVKGTNASADSFTPLPNLRYIPTNQDVANQESIAKFLVAFTDSGVIEISPWWGFESQPTFKSDITDSNKLKELSQKLRQTILDDWNGSTSYRKGLVYRVAVTQAGEIADYDYVNQAASDYLPEVPFPDLVKPETAGIGTSESASVIPQKPLAQFRVVFKPGGVLEISPW